jgi:galactokinase/galacturonokinase
MERLWQSARASRPDLAERLAARTGSPLEQVRRIVSPYRICPVGAHVDHQGGSMLATAIDAATELVFVPSETMDLESLNFAERVRFDPATPFAPGSVPALPDWGRYAWAAFAALRDRLPARPRGFTGIVEGRLPGAGLSSSASVLLAYLAAWAQANELVLEPREQVLLSMAAENEYVGVQSGVLDPAAIVGSRRDQMLAIDSSRIDWEPVTLGPGAPSTRFLVLFTGTDRSLLSTDFNLRVEECREAARWASSRLGGEGAEGADRLGDLDRRALAGLVGEIPGAPGRRARHFLEEEERVARARAAWSQGALDEFGALMSDSCRSSIENYQTGSPELIALQSIWQSTQGVLGARFSGAGFGGCSVALVEEGVAQEVARTVLERFEAAFPALAGRARVIDVRSADGLAIS